MAIQDYSKDLNNGVVQYSNGGNIGLPFAWSRATTWDGFVCTKKLLAKACWFYFNLG